MILRRRAPGFSKPLVSLSILILIVVSTSALPDLLARAAPAPDGDLVTTMKPAPNLPDGRVYDNVYGRSTAGAAQPWASSEVLGAVSSTSNGQKRQIGMFVLLLITLSAVTLLMWRHYRRDYASPRRIGRRI